MQKVRLLSWNVNGVRAAERKGFLDWLKNSKADVMCLQETKAHPEQLSQALLAPEGYTSYWHSGQRKGYSGVALYTKLKPKKVNTEFGSSILNDEGRVIMADYGSWLLYNIYFPKGEVGSPRLKYKMAFYKSFLNHIKRQLLKNRSIVITGDVNTAHQEIDLARPKENRSVSGFLPEERAWIDNLQRAGFIDSFREFNPKPGNYTWWDMKSGARARNVGWRIDYFFISQELRSGLVNAFIMPTIQGSDHCPIGVEILINS